MAAETVSSERIERNGKAYRGIKEGTATILIPENAKDGANDNSNNVQQVFYNPIQQYNRDLSVLAIKTYGEQAIQRRKETFASKAERGRNKKRKRGDDDGNSTSVEAENGQSRTEPERDGVTETAEDTTPGQKEAKLTFKILDALSASGLRALRYAREIPFVTSVKANDLSAAAAESIQRNVDYNELGDVISVTNDDALARMYRVIAEDLSHRGRHGNPSKAHKFDVVDLDPYGTAAPFFDAAVQAVRDDGGLLCITCTDSAIWAGHSYCEKTFSLYGGIPVKGLYSHEAGLRLILHAVATSAARYGLNIEPQLSLSIDFYTKLFVKVTKAPNAVKFLGAKTMLVYTCDQGCGSWETQPLMKSKPTPNKLGSGIFYKHVMALGPTADRCCQHCGFKMHVAGPMYAGHIHSQDFIQGLLDQIPKADPKVYSTLPRLEGMLRTALEENLSATEAEDSSMSKEDKLAMVDPCPFFVIPAKLAGTLSCVSPPYDMFRGALVHLGYRVRRSHCRPGSVKTDAPWSTIWWVMAEYIRQKVPVKTSKFKPTMAAYKILFDAGIIGHKAENPAASSETGAAGRATDASTEEVVDASEAMDVETHNGPTDQNTTEIPSESELRKTLVFDEELAKLGRQGGQRFVRYQMNPRANWGPMTKAKG